MAQPVNRSNKKRLWLTVAAVVVLAGAAFAYAQTRNDTDNQNPQSDGPTKQQQESAAKQEEQAKIERIEHPPAADSTGSDKVVIEASQDPNTKQVIVRTKLYGTSWSSCRLTLTKGSSVISRDVSTIYQSEYSTCAGFAIDSKAFTSGGQWTASVSAKKSDGASVSSSNSVVNVAL